MYECIIYSFLSIFSQNVHKNCCFFFFYHKTVIFLKIASSMYVVEKNLHDRTAISLECPDEALPQIPVSF